MNAVTNAEIAAAYAIADRYVVADIAELCPPAPQAGSPLQWLDTQPMLDPREHCSAAIDIHLEALRYGITRGLLVPHPSHAHLVRFTRPSTANS